ncbi:hypothetical protein [Burkholderia territorii]|uniref:hypothetical protein n=1 Tax=Burkholderia territorii TaxID=1503055 RepID=UPI000A8C9D25|nr:hypothetical protein [Burkholderia territorii]
MYQTSEMVGVRRQRGFGMMGFAAGILAVMALAGVVYVATSSSGRLQIATDQHDALANADRLLGQFAQANGRYPCPSATVNGVEDCRIKTKGWFPTSTLLPGTASFSSWLPLKYVVYRGVGTHNDPDLAATTDAYIPRLPSGTTIADYISGNPSSAMLPGDSAASYPVTLSNLDFCGKLASLRQSDDPWTALGTASSPSTSSRAFVQADSAYAQSNSAAVPRQVAYAIVASGSTNGFGSGTFAGLNGDAGVGAESPLAPIGAAYGDQVWAVSIPTAARRMQCSQTLESMDVLATALSFEDDNANTKSGLVRLLQIANNLVAQIIAEDTIFAQVRINQMAIAAYKAADAGADATADGLALNFVQMGLDLAGLGVLNGVIQATMNAAAQTLVVIADAWYRSDYTSYVGQASHANVWHGGLNILELADTLGATFQIIAP